MSRSGSIGFDCSKLIVLDFFARLSTKMPAKSLCPLCSQKKIPLAPCGRTALCYSTRSSYLPVPHSVRVFVAPLVFSFLFFFALFPTIPGVPWQDPLSAILNSIGAGPELEYFAAFRGSPYSSYPPRQSNCLDGLCSSSCSLVSVVLAVYPPTTPCGFADFEDLQKKFPSELSLFENTAS